MRKATKKKTTKKKATKQKSMSAAKIASTWRSFEPKAPFSVVLAEKSAALEKNY